MIPTTQVVPGCTLERMVCRLVNRTGGALKKGDVVCLNLDFAATAGQAMVGIDPSVAANGVTGYVAGAAITPTAGNSCHVAAVLDDLNLADDAEGTFVVRGVIPVSLANGVAKGEFITLYTNAAATTVGTHSVRTNAGKCSSISRANLDSQQAVTGVLGIAWETPGAEQTGICMFDGFAFKSMIGGGA